MSTRFDRAGNSKVSHLEAAAQQSASPEAARSERGEHDAGLAQDLAIVHAQDPAIVHTQCKHAPKTNGMPIASLTPDSQLAGACKVAVREEARRSPAHIITPELVSATPPPAATPHRVRAGVDTHAAPEVAEPRLNGSDDGTTSFEWHQGCEAGTDAPPSPPSAHDAPDSLGRLSDTGSDGASVDKSRSPKFGLARTKPAALVPAAPEVGNAAPPPVCDARSSLRAADAMSLTSPMQTGTAPRLAPAEPPSTQHQTLSVAVVSSDVPVAQTAAEAQSVAERGAALALSLMATAPPADDAQTKPRPTYGPQHVAATDSNPFMPLPCAQRSWAPHKAVATPATCPPPTPRSAADDARSVGRSSRCAAVAALGVAASSVTQPRPHRKRSRSSSSGGGAARPEAAARTAERSQKALCCVRGAPVCAPALQASWHAAPVLTRPDPRLPLFKPAPAVALFCGQVPRSLPCTAAHVTSSALLAAVWRASR